jgi:diguanylate cyclase (GGDEF)-like protein
MRRPFDLDIIGKNLGDLARGARPTLQEGGSYSGLGPVDSIPRLYVRRKSASPLYVVVGKSWDSILSLWRTEATRIGAVMLSLIAFVLAVTLFLAREIGHRAKAEEKLEELATTDALTGLKNRRKFDAEIDAEWRRAARHKTPLALLMIDADHFKAFNDSFGHQAGDEILVGIAICISDSVRRGGDCAARYGGEEFAVLLPGLGSAEAVGIAETIRLKVMEWSDGATPTTVSVGIASLTPSPGMDWSLLVKAADKALYAAKAGGRDQSVLASIPTLSLAA